MRRSRPQHHRRNHLVVSQGYGAFGPIFTDRPLVSAHHLAFSFFLVALISLSACRSKDYLSVRPVPRNPLTESLKLVSAHQAEPSERTRRLLKQYGWDDEYRSDRKSVLQQMQAMLDRDPTGAMAIALAELAYIEGFRHDTLSQERSALDWYGASMLAAYNYLFDPRFDTVRNPYDPEFRRACDLYNGSLQGALRLINAKGELAPDTDHLIHTGSIACRLRAVWDGSVPAQEIERFEFASDFEIEGLRNQHVTYGLGVPLIAVRRAREDSSDAEPHYPRTMSVPVTAFVRITRSRPASGDDSIEAELIFFDPLQSTDVVVAGRRIPLESDITTPLAYTLDSPALRESRRLDTLGLLFPEKVKDYRGVYMIDPYDPNKIPVLMVHGLWSSPLTWMEMFNDLRAYPELRSRYQFWFYLYPTAPPYWESAAAFREDLAELRRQLDPRGENETLDQMVLVGHSMGGLLSRMQVIDSGDRFWSAMATKPISEFQGTWEEKQRVAQIAFFQANRSVRRVITIATPHRGSEFANDWTEYVARKLISLPQQVLSWRYEIVRKNRAAIRAPEVFEKATSIDSLEPDSVFFPVLATTDPAPWVRQHNIVGVIEGRSMLKWFHDEPSDGVVDYTSAHLDNAVSELVVDADHSNVQRHPRAILEVRRILLEHLAEVGARRFPVRPAGAAHEAHQTATIPSAGASSFQPVPSARPAGPVSNSPTINSPAALPPP